MKVCIFCEARFDSPEWLCPVCHCSPQIEQGYPIFVPELAYRVEEYFFEAYDNANTSEKTYFWSASREQLLMWMFEKHLRHSQRFLEIGCGSGWFLSDVHQHHPQIELHATQMAALEIQGVAPHLPYVHFFQTDASLIPYDQHFDSIGIFDVLEHVHEDEKALGQMYRALKPEGKLIITVPQHPSLWSAFDEIADHKRRYTRQELVTKVKKAGFEIEHVTSFVTFLLPLMAFSRRRSIKNYSRETEFSINPLVNFTLKKVLDVERWVIQAGLSLPAGGSLLLVAKRGSSTQ